MSSTKNTSTHLAFHVKDGLFTKIGTAWTSKSGNLSVALDQWPPDGRFILLQAKTVHVTQSGHLADAEE